ncbi:hypothetical protein RvY_00007 [Ramazzottius varieornatus]|uniref:Uncharacterized protein n=1 Tax=Ramazzottius varieornatus TaxID=947166 RepID=A0A1D1UEX5_RAMVA|nr:hypothetical protein RvY_00007 [Ramazzottius varieornatus]
MEDISQKCHLKEKELTAIDNVIVMLQDALVKLKDENAQSDVKIESLLNDLRALECEEEELDNLVNIGQCHK